MTKQSRYLHPQMLHSRIPRIDPAPTQKKKVWLLKTGQLETVEMETESGNGQN